MQESRQILQYEETEPCQKAERSFDLINPISPSKALPEYTGSNNIPSLVAIKLSAFLMPSVGSAYPGPTKSSLIITSSLEGEGPLTYSRELIAN